MNFGGIQRDVDEVLIGGLFSLGFFPTYMWGRAKLNESLNEVKDRAGPVSYTHLTLPTKA